MWFGFQIFRRRVLASTAMGVLVALLLGCGGGGGGGGGGGESLSSVATWSAGLSDLKEDLSFVGLRADTTELNNKTTRQVAHVSVGGDSLRLKFSNRYGKQPLILTKVRIASSAGEGAIIPSTDTALTFSGAGGVTIAPGQDVWSDSAQFSVVAGGDVAVSVYVQGPADITTVHRMAQATRYEAVGDATSSATLPAATINSNSTYWLGEIAVFRSDRPNVLVAFGDSITDGTGSTSNANRRYPDQLSARFLKSTDGPAVSVVNMGIGGNRWEHDRFGQKGVERFQKDVLGVTGVTHALILLGVNDIGFQVTFTPNEKVTVESLIAAMSSAALAGRRVGVKVYFSTLTPFKGAGYYTEQGETIRQAVNNWIRTNSDAAGYVEFDKAIQDPIDPLRIQAGLSGDTLHPNDMGYQRMVDALDLNKFR